MVKARSVSKTNRIRCRKQPERRMRPNHPALVEKGEAAGHFEDPLDDKHDVGATCVIFVETKRDIVLQCPWQNPILKLGHLLTVPQYDRVLADEIDSRDMAIKVDSHARPIQPGRDLFDMC